MVSILTISSLKKKKTVKQNNSTIVNGVMGNKNINYYEVVIEITEF